MTSLLIRLFIRDAANVSDPTVRTRYGVLGGAVGIVCNLLLFVFKLLAGFFSGSLAVSADAFNNLSDAGASIVTIVGFALSGKAPDEKHPFGYGRIEYIAGLCISFVILAVGFEFARTSVEKIFHPQAVSFSWVSVIVLTGSILVKLWMGLFNRGIGKRIQSETIAAAALDSLSDVAATSVVLLSLLLAPVMDFPIDGVAGLLVALFILWAGFKTARDTLSPLLGQAPDPALVAELERRLLCYDEIKGVHDLIIHSYGAGQIIASVHAEVPASADIIRAHETIDLAEQEIHEQLGVILIIHLDPIVTDDERINQLRLRTIELVRRISPALSLHDFRVVDGDNRINLIFDVVVPFKFPLTETQLIHAIQDELSAEDSRLRAVIRCDRGYVGH